jgi:undecaprenyl-diphosphatase
MLETIMSWDEEIFRRINGDWHAPLLDILFPLVTAWNNFAIPFLLVALVVIAVGRWRGLRFVLLALVSVLVADAIGAHLMKTMVERPRPCITIDEVEGIRLLAGCTTSSSFPSNHAVNASVLATLAGLYARPLLVPATIVALLVIYSRVYVGVHYPLDVLAGSLLGIAVALALSWAITALPRFLTMWQKAAPSGPRPIHTLKPQDR